MGSKEETGLSKAIQDAIAVAFPLALVVRTNSGKVKVHGGWMHLAPDGFPDITVILPFGGSCYGEVKRPGQKLNEAQVAMHAKLKARGHFVWIWESPEEAVACVAHAIEQQRQRAA